ncbi:MAG: hypothetical protein EBV03_00715 [Proteobacteria bacterium]|nr:hypothetical protein [Pseudomonadota bacterium]
MCIKPKAGADVAVIVSENGQNRSEALARQLHADMVEEYKLQDRTLPPFEPGKAFEHPNGVAFWLNQDPAAGGMMLEFIGPDLPEAKAHALAQLPLMFKQAGVKDEAALGQLERFVGQVGKPARTPYAS